MTAILEDYPIILNSLDYQLKLREKLASIDFSNPFLKDSSKEAIEEKIKTVQDEFNDFKKSAKKDEPAKIDEETKSPKANIADEIYL